MLSGVILATSDMSNCLYFGYMYVHAQIMY